MRIEQTGARLGGDILGAPKVPPSVGNVPSSAIEELTYRILSEADFVEGIVAQLSSLVDRTFGHSAPKDDGPERCIVNATLPKANAAIDRLSRATADLKEQTEHLLRL